MHMNNLLKATYTPVFAWLLAAAVFSVIALETSLAESHVVFVYARLATYIAALMASALLLGMVALFGLGCGLMLWWLDDALPAKTVARAVTMGLWAGVAYIGIGIVLFLIDPPVGFTVADLTTPEKLEAEFQDLLALRWMQRLQYVAGAAYVVVAGWLLARQARPWNAVLAVAFGVAALAALMAGLSALPDLDVE